MASALIIRSRLVYFTTVVTKTLNKGCFVFDVRQYNTENISECNNKKGSFMDSKIKGGRTNTGC